MLTTFQLISLVCILAVTIAGGYLPLARQEGTKGSEGFPMGEAFTAGVFLALAVTMMLPSAIHLLNEAFPHAYYPIASVISISAFILLLGLERITVHIRRTGASSAGVLDPPSIPVIMTVMIAIPSFFLGTALGVSASSAAVFIFVAIMVHKSSAAFALALKMVRSTMTRSQTFLLFGMFALSTPIGIVLGEDLHAYLPGHTMMVVKGAILALAAGTFLFMSTVHGMENAPLIRYCASKKGFFVMLSGFVLTALVRLLIGEAHRI